MSNPQANPLHESPQKAIERCLREVCRSSTLGKAWATKTNIRAHCRRNDDRKPSLYIYKRADRHGIERWFYKCHSCQAKGTLVDLIAEEAGLERYEAARVLSGYLGEQVSSTLDTNLRRENRENAVVLDIVAEYCHSIAWLGSPFYEKQMGRQREYLEGRASLRQVRQLGLGIAPNSILREADLEKFLQRKERMDLLEDVKRVLERIACRIVVPVRDESGHVVSLCSRRASNAQYNRYRNEGSKGQVLLGINAAQDAIHRAGYAIVVEGPFDLFTLRELGARCLDKVLEDGKDAAGSLGNTVACMSSRPTVDQMRNLKRHTNAFIMVRDGDKADDCDEAKAIIADASNVGLQATVVAMPDGMDPDEYVRHLLAMRMHPSEALKAFIDGVLKIGSSIGTEAAVNTPPNRASVTEQHGQPISPYEAYSKADNKPHVKVGREKLRQILAECSTSELVVWLALKIQVSRQRAKDGKVLVIGRSIAGDCRRSWRQVRTVMAGLREKGMIAYASLHEHTQFEIELASSPTANANHIRVPYDFVWGGHAEAVGSALPTLLALKAACIGKKPVTNILVKTIASRTYRSERAVKADLKYLAERHHVRECKTNGRVVRLVSLLPVTSEVYGEPNQHDT
jgi:hypothetical protein